jgi:hypothetical protein
MTREELLNDFARKRAAKITLTWTQFTNAVSNAPALSKTAILNAANSGDGRVLFTEISNLVKDKKNTLARAEIDLVAADNSLTIDELIAILG